MAWVRHSKTFTRTVDGMTYSSTRTRRMFGPYQTPAEKMTNAKIIFGLMAIMFAVGWPWAFLITDWLRVPLATISVSVLIYLLVALRSVR